MDYIKPQSMTEAMELARMLAKSSVVGKDLAEKPADILQIILTGMELGFGPVQSLRMLVPMKGKVSMSADAIAALVTMRRDVCEYITLVEHTDTQCVYEAKRAGSPKADRFVFTMDDAKKAGLLSGPNSAMYTKFPKAMLRARCLTMLCRALFPDLAAGLYDSDTGELTDGVPVRPFVPAGAAQASPATASRQAPTAEPSPSTGGSSTTTPPTANASETAPSTASSAPVMPLTNAGREELDDFEKLVVKLNEVQSLGALSALIPDIQRMSKADKDELRKKYMARKAELEKEAQP